MSITIHQHNELGYYTGQTMVIDDLGGIPKRWTAVELPVIPEGQFARLDGNSWVIESEFKEIKIVPREVTNYQGKVTLMAFGLYDSTVSLINASNDPATQVAWNAASFQRESSIIKTLAVSLGVTEEQMDDMFIYAAKVF